VGDDTPIAVDIKVKKQANGMWRADLSGHGAKEILFFYGKSPAEAARKAIEYLQDLGTVLNTEIVFKGAN
jgi:hypothetical protein